MESQHMKDGFTCFVGGPNYEELERKRKLGLVRVVLSKVKPPTGDERRLERLKDRSVERYHVDDTTLMVEEFHRKFYLNETLDNIPQIPSHKLCLLRIQCLTEEVAELAHAFGKSDIVEVLDALTDIQYFLDGTYLLCGLDGVKLPAMLEVHRSNLTKLDSDGLPVKDASGRVTKSKNYVPPDLGKVLSDYKAWREKSQINAVETPREERRTKKNDELLGG